MLGRWNDILINANWTDKKIGFFRIWVDGKLAFKYNGPTKSKGKKVLYALFDDNDEKMDYVTSRKKVYVPQYYDLIKDKDIIEEYKQILMTGKNIIIYDFDGPRHINGNVLCLELTNDLLIDKINDTRHPFGHGYIVASCINTIHPSNYIN